MNGKRTRAAALFAILVCVGLLIAAPVFSQAKKVYVNGFDGNYPPFTYIDKDGKPDGIYIQVAKWIAKEMGFEIEFKAVAWDAIIPTLQAKKIDFISTMTPTPERMKVVDFTSPVVDATFLAVVVREDSDLTMATALIGKNAIAVDRGASAEDWINTNLVQAGILPQAKFKLYDNALLAIQDVENGRANASINDEFMVREAIKGRPMKVIGLITAPDSDNFAVRKEDVELKRLLNEGIKRIRQSPYYEQLVKQYLKK